MPRRKPYIPPPTPTPPKVYCPNCEGEARDTGHWNIYNCTNCKRILFMDELDTFPGQTKGRKIILHLHKTRQASQ